MEGLGFRLNHQREGGKKACQGQPVVPPSLHIVLPQRCTPLTCPCLSTSCLLPSSFPQAYNENRAWFDEQRGYQMVRQSRVPLSLPQVLVINCSPSDMDDVAWWSADEVRGLMSVWGWNGG